MQSKVFRYAGFYAVLLSIAAIPAFWPTYLSQLPQGLDIPTHVHAVTVTLWLAMLIVQPWLVLSGRHLWHRRIGRISYFLFPVILIAPFFVMHLHLQQYSPDELREYARDYYIVPAMAVTIASAYGLAVWYRKSPNRHGFYMLCTSLALVNPIFQRIYGHYFGVLDESRQELINFMIIDVILIAVILFVDKARGFRSAAWAMLAIYLAVELPLFTVARTASWVGVIAWFRDLGC